MLGYGPQNYTSIGETAILVFLNVILLREGYKFVDMTIRCIAIVTKILCMEKYAFSLATIPISYSHDRYFAELKFCIVFSAILFVLCVNYN